MFVCVGVSGGVCVCVGVCGCVCACASICVCINAGMPDSPASDQSSNGMKKSNNAYSYLSYIVLDLK